MEKKSFVACIAATLVVLLTPAFTAGAQTVGGRYALIIGEGGYETLKPALVNPLNDAADMKNTLEGLGFTVDLVRDGTLEEMKAGVDRLCDNLSASPDNIGFFFFAGHGMQEADRNFLIPVEARLQRVGDLQQNAFDVQFELYDKLRVANNALNMVVLDACRNMPLPRSVRLTEDPAAAPKTGLAAVAFQPAGSIIVYATGPGQEASDGSGRNGLFTGKLLENLRNSSLAVAEVFRRTALDVQRANSKQLPVIYSQFHQQVYLGGGAAGVAEIAASPEAQEAARIVYLEKQKPGRPDWLSSPLRFALANNYEEKGSTLSRPQWFYAVGQSAKASTEQTARTRAQQNVQADVAANIANNFEALVELTENSVFRASDIEDVQRLIQTAVTSSIKTRVPRYEPLEWYIETGNDNGKDWYRAYVLVRLVRQDMIGVVNNVDPEKVIDSLMAQAEKNNLIPQGTQMPPGDRRVMVQQVIKVRDYIVEGITKGLTGF